MTRYTEAMAVSVETFERLALEEPNRWELHCGRLVRRPDMTMPHNDLSMRLAMLLANQLDQKRFRLRSQSGHVTRPTESYFIPDVSVLPVELTDRFRGRRVLEKYADALPFVAEVWSPSTGDYDVAEKLAEYRRRGDREVWLVHPFERTVTAWRRQTDGAYRESVYTTGRIPVESLPGIAVEFDDLFDYV
jgi:Uma2 family endonuclease